MTFSCTHFSHGLAKNDQLRMLAKFSLQVKGDPPSWIVYSMPVNSSNLPSMRTKKWVHQLYLRSIYSVVRS